MTENEPRDVWKKTPRGSEGDADKDFEPLRPEQDDLAAPEEPDLAAPEEPDRYAPRHRAPGRPPLIRRRRNNEGESEEITWETPWTRTEDDSGRWSEEEVSALSPPPAPIEEVPDLGLTRAEQRKKRARPTPEEERELVRRSRDYTGRHLAPKKGALFGRSGASEVEEGASADEQADEQAVAEDDLEHRDSAASATTAPTDQAPARPDSEPEPPELQPEPSEPQPEPQPQPEPPEPQPKVHMPARPEAPLDPDPVVPLDVSDVREETEEGQSSGPRTAALQERKKKKRRWTAAGGIAAVVVAIGAIAGAGLLVKNVVDPEKERVAVPLERPEEGTLGGTTLVFGTKESNSSGRGAIWMTLLSLDPETGKGSVVYIPPHTAVEVPGRGLQGVGEAYGSGGIPLLLVSTENLLGVKIDRYLELSDKDALVFFEKLDPMTVDVPAEVRVPVGQDQARLIFVEGPQELSPSLLVKLLYIVGIDGDDVELGSRHLAFWDELLNVYADGSDLAAVVEDAGAALAESDASAEEHGAFLAALADLPTEDLTITALPVRPISAGESELYATDEAELVAFVEETIGVDQETPQEIRIQVLNGNGVPGIGQEVADKLVGEGFRVILSGNARRLNYRKTLVIAYDNSEEGVALAERARDLLGVGEVQVSAQQQGIVDLTIVVGKDFLRAR